MREDSVIELMMKMKFKGQFLKMKYKNSKINHRIFNPSLFIMDVILKIIS